MTWESKGRLNILFKTGTGYAKGRKGIGRKRNEMKRMKEGEGKTEEREKRGGD